MFTKFVKSEKVEEIGQGEVGILQLFTLFLKSVYSTNIGKVLIIFSPMLVSIALSVMFPIYIAVGAAQVFVTALSAGVIWGMTYFSIRRTTFYYNLHSTKVSIVKVYFSILLVMLFVTFWSETTFWLTTIFLDLINVNSIVGSALNIVGDEKDMNWLLVDWLTLIYTYLASVVLMFLACFATREIFKTEQTFFIILIVYILVLIPFGGILPPSQSNFHYENGAIIFDRDITFVRAVSMALPQYNLNLFNYASVWAGTVQIDSSGMIDTLGNMSWLSSFKWSESWQWNFTILQPIAFGIILIFISCLTILKSKNNI